LDALDEAQRRLPQGQLRVDAELARCVDRGKEDVAELLERPLGRGLTQLRDFLLEISERPRSIRVLEADSRCALLHLASEDERRQRPGDPGEERFVLPDLDPLPVLPHAARRLGLDVPEHVRMTADELVVDRARNRLEIPFAALLEQEREEEDLVE